MARFVTNVLPVWIITAVGVMWVVWGVSEGRRYSAMVAVLATSVIASFALQILAYRSGGLVSRLSLAIAGSVLLTALAAVIFQVQSVVD